MDDEEHDSVLRRALRGQSRRSVLLADSARFGRRAHLRTFDLGEGLGIVTDKPPPGPVRNAFARP